MILPSPKFVYPSPSFNPSFFPTPSLCQTTNAINPTPSLCQTTNAIKFSEYQQNYSKTFDSLKVKYKRSLPFSLSLEEVGKCSIFLYTYTLQKQNDQRFILEGSELNELQKKKVYCFLCTLVFFEVAFQKNHEIFVFYRY